MRGADRPVHGSPTELRNPTGRRLRRTPTDGGSAAGAPNLLARRPFGDRLQHFVARGARGTAHPIDEQLARLYVVVFGEGARQSVAIFRALGFFEQATHELAVARLSAFGERRDSALPQSVLSVFGDFPPLRFDPFERAELFAS